MSAPPRASLTVTSRSLRRLRVSAAATRWLLYAVAAVGIVATVRFTVAPPRATIRPAAVVAARDPAAEGFAELFARRYLTFDSRRPQAHRVALAAFVGTAMDADGGLRLPVSGAQRVRWTQTVQERSGMTGERVYTVAADTDRAGLLYLAVAVRRTRLGSLALGGYPALVGQPTVTAAEPTAKADEREVGDRELAGVVRRALENYMAGSAVNLAADLSARAHVALPGLALVLERVSALVWSPGGGAVLATVQTQDRWGTGYVLRYELDVSRATGRWEIGAIHMDPTT